MAFNKPPQGEECGVPYLGLGESDTLHEYYQIDVTREMAYA
jgi:hypothetical protein